MDFYTEYLIKDLARLNAVFNWSFFYNGKRILDNIFAKKKEKKNDTDTFCNITKMLSFLCICKFLLLLIYYI